MEPELVRRDFSTGTSVILDGLSVWTSWEALRGQGAREQVQVTPNHAPTFLDEIGSSAAHRRENQTAETLRAQGKTPSAFRGSDRGQLVSSRPRHSGRKDRFHDGSRELNLQLRIDSASQNRKICITG